MNRNSIFAAFDRKFRAWLESMETHAARASRLRLDKWFKNTEYSWNQGPSSPRDPQSQFAKSIYVPIPRYIFFFDGENVGSDMVRASRDPAAFRVMSLNESGTSIKHYSNWNQWHLADVDRLLIEIWDTRHLPWQATKLINGKPEPVRSTTRSLHLDWRKAHDLIWVSDDAWGWDIRNDDREGDIVPTNSTLRVAEYLSHAIVCWRRI